MLIEIVGPSFKGKSVSAATFPKPMLYLDLDSGFSSVPNAKDKGGVSIVPDAEKITVVEFVRENISRLDFKVQMTEKNKIMSAPPFAKESLKILEKYNTIMQQLLETEKYEGTGPFQSMIIDNLSTFFRIWKNGIQAANARPTLVISDYLFLEQILYDQFLPDLKALNKKIPYIICLNHEDITKDELTGRIEEFPIGPSQSMGKAFGKEFDEVWRMEVSGDQYSWRTKAHGYFIGAGSRHNLPDKITPATFQELSKYLVKKEVGK
jgi:hypothetical protein